MCDEQCKTNESIVSHFEKWQYDMAHKTGGVYVCWYELKPQAIGFLIDYQLMIDGKYDPDLGPERSYAYGDSILNCINQIDARIQAEKQIILNNLKD